MLSHGNIASNAATGAAVFPLTPDDRLLSFLPWAHSYGQLELNWALAQGASLALNDDIKQLLPNLAEVKPTILVAVPRIFHRVYEAVRNDLSRTPALRAEAVRRRHPQRDSQAPRRARSARSRGSSSRSTTS